MNRLSIDSVKFDGTSHPSFIREPYRDEGDGSTRLLVPPEGLGGGGDRESSFERRLAVPPRAAATASLDRQVSNSHCVNINCVTMYGDRLKSMLQVA